MDLCIKQRVNTQAILILPQCTKNPRKVVLMFFHLLTVGSDNWISFAWSNVFQLTLPQGKWSTKHFFLFGVIFELQGVLKVRGSEINLIITSKTRFYKHDQWSRVCWMIVIIYHCLWTAHCFFWVRVIANNTSFSFSPRVEHIFTPSKIQKNQPIRKELFKPPQAKFYS